MNAVRKGDGDRGIRRGRVVGSLVKDRSALVMVFLLSVLVASTLSGGSTSAADRVADVPCEVCGEAADPVQYGFMARFVSRAANLAREAEIARLRGLAGPGAGNLARVDEVVHLRGLEAARSGAAASLAREAEIARLRGLSGPGAGSSVRFDEVVHLRGLVEAARSSAAAEDCC